MADFSDEFASVDYPAIEQESEIVIDGKAASVYLEGWGWHVWMAGKGNLAYAYNREDAIAEAVARVAGWKSQYLFQLWQSTARAFQFNSRVTAENVKTAHDNYRAAERAHQLARRDAGLPYVLPEGKNE